MDKEQVTLLCLIKWTDGNPFRNETETWHFKMKPEAF